MAWINELTQWVDLWQATLGWPSEVLLRLLVAAVLGGAIGLEREVRGHEAGFRTNLLVSLGCALAMIVSLQFARMDWAQWPTAAKFIHVDPARIAYGVMGGIGFLGAGAIMHTKGLIRGMTTAASIWCTAAIGLATGVGMLTIAAFTTALVILALILLRAVEPLFPNREDASVVLTLPDGQDNDPQDGSDDTNDRSRTPADILAIRDRFNTLGFSVKQLDLEHDDDHGRWTLTVMCHHFENKFSELIDEIDQHPRWRLQAVRRLQQ